MSTFRGLRENNPIWVEEYYDYIIVGAGCAGLSLAVHMIRSGRFSDKKILIVDKEEKKDDDRTWCFWENGEGEFETLVCKQWKRANILSDREVINLDLGPYAYKMIRGADFYAYCFSLIRSQANITFLRANIEKIFSEYGKTGLIADGRTVTSSYVFSSVLFEKPQLSKKHYWLLQHFKGVFLKSDRPVFTPESATLMDFTTSQKNGASFFYVLPFDAYTALVEYTVFSPATLSEQAYDEKLEEYIMDVLKIDRYSILQEERGVIPMTNFPFARMKNRIVYIGTAGGQTKGSSGYTFRFIQKHSRWLVRELCRNKDISKSQVNRRFSFYDSVLLRVLKRGQPNGREIFLSLFGRNNTHTVLKFLDNETTLQEDLRIISKLPFVPFLRAALEQIF